MVSSEHGRRTISNAAGGRVTVNRPNSVKGTALAMNSKGFASDGSNNPHPERSKSSHRNRTPLPLFAFPGNSLVNQTTFRRFVCVSLRSIRCVVDEAQPTVPFEFESKAECMSALSCNCMVGIRFSRMIWLTLSWLALRSQTQRRSGYIELNNIHSLSLPLSCFLR